jgi:SAM-dependent methyltransferase
MTESAKPWAKIQAAAGHLDYYLKHKISPVHQDIGDLDAHLDRRRSLYRSLGILPNHFHNSSILEVGPGSGHNSLYVASTQPRRYDLVEPNPVAVADIGALYDGFSPPHTRPTVHAVKLEDFQPQAMFDVCISEGWLGSAENEHVALAKLASFVAPGGVLCLTTVSPTSIVPNVLRKVVSQRLIQGIEGLKAQTDHLLTCWGPHLATIPSMSRPHADWIQDNMLNPAYYGVCLTPGMISETIGAEFSFYNCSPRVTTDWRWYKSLTGAQKAFNENFLRSYMEQLHNLLDYTTLMPARDADENGALETHSWELLAAANDWEKSGCGDSGPVLAAARMVADDIRRFSPTIADAVDECVEVFAKDHLTVADAVGMVRFKTLFGREMLYVSLVRDEA